MGFASGSRAKRGPRRPSFLLSIILLKRVWHWLPPRRICHVVGAVCPSIYKALLHETDKKVGEKACFCGIWIKVANSKGGQQISLGLSFILFGERIKPRIISKKICLLSHQTKTIFCFSYCFLDYNIVFSRKSYNFVIVIRRDSPETEGIHCLSVTLNSGTINCRERALNRPCLDMYWSLCYYI